MATAHSATTPASRQTARAAEPGLFYVAMAAAIAVIAIGSFVPTYWVQLPAGTFVGTPLVHLHAVAFTAWPLLLLSQTLIAARGNIRNHRAWGLVGISLATILLLLGLSTAIGSMHARIAEGFGPAGRAFAIVPISSMLLFTGFFIAAIANINRAEWHKRWILLASIALLQAPLARVVFLLATGGGPGLRPGMNPPLPVSGTWIAAAMMDLLVVAGIAYDWKSRGRPHPAWLIGGAIILAVQFARVPLSTSSVWQSFAEMLDVFA